MKEMPADWSAGIFMLARKENYEFKDQKNGRAGLRAPL